MTSPSDSLDLHSLAVLINYERASGPVSDPRFRYAKLREVASDGKFTTVQFPDNQWDEVPDDRSKRGFLFDTILPPVDHDSEADLPTTILGPRSEPSATSLSAEELEIIFWEVRGHDGCYQSIAIFQELADLYKPSQSLRIRLRDGTDFITTLSARAILEFTLQEPKQTTLSVVLETSRSADAHVTSQCRYTGESAKMLHSVWGFARPDEENVSAVLDLASMQFGAKGRGKSGDFFVLDTMDRWKKNLEQVVQGCEPYRASQRIRPGSDAERENWYKKVAERVKERWEARAVSHWCGLCGKPDAWKCCGRCRKEYYCSEAHSGAAWKHWHKKWCQPRAAN
jgi:hypothetical protein